MQGFFRDIFNFQEVRYTTIEDLAEDILIKAKEASERAWERLAPDPEEEEDGQNEQMLL